MSFADRLKISRKEKGYSQEQLAEMLEVSRQSITKWETGTAYPELRKLILLSVLLDKDLDWLLFDERNKLSGNRAEPDDEWKAPPQFYDRKSLRTAMRDNRISEILRALEGIEFMEEVDEDGFSGNRYYTIFQSRMFVESHGINRKDGKEENDFSELEMSDAVQVLAKNAWRLQNREESRG